MESDKKKNVKKGAPGKQVRKRKTSLLDSAIRGSQTPPFGGEAV